MQTQNTREIFYYKIPVFIVDLTIHLGCLYFLLYNLPYNLLVGTDGYNDIGIYCILTVAFSVSISIFGLKFHERRIKPLEIVWRAIKQTTITYLLFTILLSFIYKATPRQLLLICLGITLLLITSWHFIANFGVRQFRKIGRNTRRVVIVGADITAKRLYKELCYGQLYTGYKVEGFFSSFENLELPEGANFLGPVEDSFDWIIEHNPDEVYCSLPPDICNKEVNNLIKICNDRFIDFFFVPTFDGYPHRQMTIRQFGRVSIIRLREEPLNSPVAKMGKRLFDIVASSIFLCTIFPFVFLFVWIGNIITGNVGPVFFKQSRTGYNGKNFKIYKFRSMKVNADADKLQATKDDPRKTPFGDFLRRSSIDELPQFINVLKGEMSIIGPRPHMEHHTEIYSELISNYMVRHLAKPGITGWAQINGCRGETKTVEEMKDRVEHDIWYIEHWTPILDTEIFFKTIWQVLPGHDKQAY